MKAAGAKPQSLATNLIGRGPASPNPGVAINNLSAAAAWHPLTNVICESTVPMKNRNIAGLTRPAVAQINEWLLADLQPPAEICSQHSKLSRPVSRLRKRRAKQLDPLPIVSQQ